MQLLFLVDGALMWLLNSTRPNMGTVNGMGENLCPRQLISCISLQNWGLRRKLNSGSVGAFWISIICDTEQAVDFSTYHHPWLNFWVPLSIFGLHPIYISPLDDYVVEARGAGIWFCFLNALLCIAGLPYKRGFPIKWRNRCTAWFCLEVTQFETRMWRVSKQREETQLLNEHLF